MRKNKEHKEKQKQNKNKPNNKTKKKKLFLLNMFIYFYFYSTSDFIPVKGKVMNICIILRKFLILVDFVLLDCCCARLRNLLESTHKTRKAFCFTKVFWLSKSRKF